MKELSNVCIGCGETITLQCLKGAVGIAVAMAHEECLLLNVKEI